MRQAILKYLLSSVLLLLVISVSAQDKKEERDSLKGIHMPLEDVALAAGKFVTSLLFI